MSLEKEREGKRQFQRDRMACGTKHEEERQGVRKMEKEGAEKRKQATN